MRYVNNRRLYDSTLGVVKILQPRRSTTPFNVITMDTNHCWPIRSDNSAPSKIQNRWDKTIRPAFCLYDRLFSLHVVAFLLLRWTWVLLRFGCLVVIVQVYPKIAFRLLTLCIADSAELLATMGQALSSLQHRPGSTTSDRVGPAEQQGGNGFTTPVRSQTKLLDDPRSPGANRTPIVLESNKSGHHGELVVADPRSPSMQVSRTPIRPASETDENQTQVAGKQSKKTQVTAVLGEHN